MIQSRVVQVGIAKQTAKGSIPANALYQFGVESGRMVGVNVTDDPLNLTWSTYVVEGFDRKLVVPVVEFTTVATPAITGLFLLGVLGADAASGAGPYTHVFTPTDDLPYITFWARYGGTNAFYQQVQDAKISEVELTYDGAGAVKARVRAFGCNIVPLASPFTATNSERVNGGFLDAGAGIFQLDGASAVTQQGSVTFNRRMVPQPIANSVVPNDVVPGDLAVDWQMRVQPNDLNYWREMVYGSAGGTTVATAPYFGAVTMKFIQDANTDLNITAPRVKYATEFPEANPQGGPAEAAVDGMTAAPTSGAAVTATLRNAVASY